MQRIAFRGHDIGSEILPILTSGLYHDTLDALREYIQNAIDADATIVHLSINPNAVSITDNGTGMDQQQAVRAMRLGISDKNPEIHVGFRGIGIYSAFDICNTLEIHTRSAASTETYRIQFNFGAMRAKLEFERDRRVQGLPPDLHLEKLLHDCVFVDSESDVELGAHGTKVILIGIRSEAYLRLNDWSEVVDYLQNVIPLPFSPNFKFGDMLTTLFEAKDYRVISSLRLRLGGREEELYRPYTNALFHHRGKYDPITMELTDGQSGRRYGFAWICINDARSVLKDTRLRGLLIKKFGFSIADRRYLESYFPRLVFSRRITGEVIIQNEELIPNAARNDFESNLVRQAFLRYLPSFTRDVDSWANEIQESERAKEVLSILTAELAEASNDLPKARRDIEHLLRVNRNLVDIDRRLNVQRGRLSKVDSAGLARADKLLSGAKQFVEVCLTQHQQEKEKEKQQLTEEVVKAVARQSIKPTKDQESRNRNIPKDLVSLLSALGLLESAELKRIIEFIDGTIIQPNLDEAEYASSLRDLQDFIEEGE